MESDVMTLLTRGLTSVSRDGEGLFLNFSGVPGMPEFRIAIHSADARGMLESLRSLVRYLEQPVGQTSPSIDLH